MDGAQRSIEDAVSAWARAIFAAPRRLGALITGVEQHDEIIERVAAHIIRRELHEVRGATAERRVTRPRLAEAAIDPFAHTPQTLRAVSEHVVACASCAGAGHSRCETCSGIGRAPCPGCGGSGKELSAETGRLVNCKACKASGSAFCRGCDGSGRMACQACGGGGYQLAWLTLKETQRCEVELPREPPAAFAHRALHQPRVLSHQELSAMAILDEQTRDGPLELGPLAAPERDLVKAQLRKVDPRFERIDRQQYLKLVVIRRDVVFEMCGVAGTLSLSGTMLEATTTPEALRPIHRRLYGWCALTAAVLLAGIALRDATVGTTSYFRGARLASGVLVAIAAGCAVPALGAILRAWRGGRRFHPVDWPAKLWSAAAVAALLAIAVVGVAMRPDAAEIPVALAANDVATARELLAALEEHTGATPEVQALDDQIMLVEASQLQGDDRLRLLDLVAGRHGDAASGAATQARAQRIDEIRQLISQRRPAEALAALDRVGSQDRGGDVVELRALAHDAAFAICATVGCRLGEALQAEAAQVTPARTAAAEAARGEARGAIDRARIDAVTPLARLQQLRALHDDAASIVELEPGDPDLQTRARDAIRFAQAERAATALLGNGLEIAEELLGPSTRDHRGVASFGLGGITASLRIDRRGRCVGVAVVGDRLPDREIDSASWPAERLLSQILGRPMAVPPPSAPRSYAGKIPVVALWSGAALVELRVGAAAP